MTIWRWAWLGLLALMLGCTGMSTQNGDAYFAQQEYQKAMQSYIRSLQVRSVDGNRYIQYSPEIMTKIGISALNMNMWDGAIKVFTYVNKKTPSYGLANFYLGMCFERQGKLKQAQQIYANYKILGVEDPARDAMKGRLYFLQRQKNIKDAQMMAARGPSSQSTYSTQRMVVLDFHYSGSNLKGTILSKGITTLVIDDLNRIGGFQVISRDKAFQLMQAMGWRSSDLKNIENLEKLQKMLGVGTVVQGELQIVGSGNLKLNQRTLTFTGVRNVKESSFQGPLQNVVLLQKKIVVNVLKDLGIQLTAAQTNILKTPATRSLNAFLNYAYAIHALDLSQYTVAQNYFMRAINADPNFLLANEMMSSPDVFDAVQTGDWVAMQTKLNKILKIKPASQTDDDGYGAWVSLSPIDRLQEMGWYLDAGFIPGSDSRDAFEGVDMDDLEELFPDLTNGLPDPPNPPEQHYPVDPWYLPDPPPPPHRP